MRCASAAVRHVQRQRVAGDRSAVEHVIVVAPASRCVRHHHGPRAHAARRGPVRRDGDGIVERAGRRRGPIPPAERRSAVEASRPRTNMHAATFARTTPLHADDGRAARSPHPSRPDRQASASTAIAGIGTAGRCAQHMGILQDRADVAPCRQSLQATCRALSAEAPPPGPDTRGRALPHCRHPVAIRRPPGRNARRNAPVERELASLTPTPAGRTDRLDAGRFQRVAPATGSCAPGGYRQRIETAQHHVVAERAMVLEPLANY